MAYRYGDREQANLFPQSIEDYVEQSDPVRAYNAFVDALDFIKLGIKLDPYKLGNSQYDPKSMLKLLVYGYSYGHQSSRKLERVTHHNLSFILIMGGMKPDHKTISKFRKDNKVALAKVLKQCVRMCLNLNLIEGNVLFVDGSKFRGNASISAFYTKERAEKSLEKMDERINNILAECEKIDVHEESNPSLVKLEKNLAKNETLKNKMKDLLDKFNNEDKKKRSINLTDSEVRKMNGRQGSHAGLNVQMVTDEKHGLIVSSDVTDKNNDLNQLSTQVENANANLEKSCNTIVADAGYSTTSELKQVHEQGIEVIVPSQRQSLKKESSEFSKEKFTYDENNDIYVCPEGHILTPRGMVVVDYQRRYQIKNKQNCLRCPYFGKCTSSKEGRSITRLVDEKWKEHFEGHYEKAESKLIYKKRQEKVELPFGHFKRNLGIGAFFVRGIKGAKAEISVLSTCFNLTRMITIMGVPALVKVMQR